MKIKISLEGWVMILILFGYAQNDLVWQFFSSSPRVHHFPGGQEYELTWQQIVKGFTDICLQFIKAIGASLLFRRYNSNIAWFFYVMAAYPAFNMILYWYNYCQWQWPFYLMWACMLIAAWRLWPRVFKLRRV